MNLKTRLLNAAILIALTVSTAQAQQAPATQPQCDADGCRTEQGLVFRVRSYGEQRPVDAGITAAAEDETLTERPARAGLFSSSRTILFV